MMAAMHRGAAVLAAHMQAGEGAALDRLDRFLDGPIDGYRDRRDFPAANATSNMSEHLTWGEVSPATLWHAGLAAIERGAAGAEHFLKELVWRDFAWHLTHHTPELLDRSWRPEWADFPWSTDEGSAEVTAWKQARTGVPLVDAGLREMYVTGRMHNRVRMVVASYLTKNLLAHWRIGQVWFAECLTDWDPASNAMGWQWVAGSGPDAAPYFRVFNPVTQAEKFDAERAYLRRWLAEGQKDPSPESLAYFDAVPHSWGLDPNGSYPHPKDDLSSGRARALAAYDDFRRRQDARNP
jgi:deoxyribodipyrimidine photo-lyase